MLELLRVSENIFHDLRNLICIRNRRHPHLLPPHWFTIKGNRTVAVHLFSVKFFSSFLDQNVSQEKSFSYNKNRYDNLSLILLFSKWFRMIRGVQGVWGTSAETYLVPFLRISAPTFPHLPPNVWTLAEWIISPTRCAKNRYVTRHKRIVRDATGLLSSDKSKTPSFLISEVWQGCDSVRD